MRRKLTREGIKALMNELARSAPGRRSYRVFFVGGSTAVLAGWRESTIDADLHSDQEEVFRDVQGIKERLQLNIMWLWQKAVASGYGAARPPAGLRRSAP